MIVTEVLSQKMVTKRSTMQFSSTTSFEEQPQYGNMKCNVLCIHVVHECLCVHSFVSMLSYGKFFARKTSMFTLLGFKHVRWHVTTFPDVLKSLSEGELVAGMQRYFLASLLSFGQLTWWSLHQASGSASLSMVGDSRQLLSSASTACARCTEDEEGTGATLKKLPSDFLALFSVALGGSMIWASDSVESLSYRENTMGTHAFSFCTNIQLNVLFHSRSCNIYIIKHILSPLYQTL